MPAVSLIHESVTPLETTLPMSDLKALWVREDLLVWQTSQRQLLRMVGRSVHGCRR